MLTEAEKHVDLAITQHDREELSNALSLFLADTYALYLKTQNYHWNVRGARFPALHVLFENQYQELADAVDVIAERIRALGYLAPGTFSEFLKLSSLEEGRSESSSKEMVASLMHDHEHLAQNARAMFPKAEKLNDHASVELFAQRMTAHEKTAWMLRSTLDE